jgi:hypothetical protein
MKSFRSFLMAAPLILGAVIPAVAQPAPVPMTTAWPPGRSVLFCYTPASSPTFTAGVCGANGFPVWVTPQTSNDTTPPAQISCGTSATLVENADTAAIHRELINNLATGVVYWGKSAGVTTGTGFPIAPGSGYDFSGYSGAIYCIAGAPITTGFAKW